MHHTLFGTLSFSASLTKLERAAYTELTSKEGERGMRKEDAVWEKPYGSMDWSYGSSGYFIMAPSRTFFET